MDEPVKPTRSKPRRSTKKVNGGNGAAKKSLSEELSNLLKAVDNDAIIGIFSHSCPDPDAIASMMGIQWLIQKCFGLESHLLYSGEVSHPQNNSMVNLLSPGLKKFSSIEEDLTGAKALGDYALKILVDTVPEHAGTNGAEIQFDVVIDHHRDLPKSFNGLLIHKKSGSCSAIVYELMHDIVPEDDWLNTETDADTKVATALVAGIMTDTHFMLSDDCTEIDRYAFNELFEYRNSNFLNQIVFFKRRKFWIERKAAAVDQASVDEEGYAIVGLGLIPERERDLIADMAEEMVSWANVETAVAFALVGGDRIEGSVRSVNSSLTVADFCKKLGGKHGSGGGKLGKGAYQLPLGGFSIDDDEDEEDALQAWEAIKNRETKRINRVINK